jgi:hypothetical protein
MNVLLAIAVIVGVLILYGVALVALGILATVMESGE